MAFFTGAALVFDVARGVPALTMSAITWLHGDVLKSLLMEALCCVCFYLNDIDDDDRETVCENCWTALMVYEDGSTEPT